MGELRINYMTTARGNQVMDSWGLVTLTLHPLR